MHASLPVVSDSLSLYLQEISRFRLLDEQEEKEHAIRFFEKKDIEAAQILITSNLRFVVKIASEYRSYGLKMLDLIQEGNIGLMMAVRKFNPYKGFRLISYAVWWIRAYIQNYIVSAWSLLKIGTTQAQRKLFFKLRQAKNAIINMGNGEEDLDATALSLNVTGKEAAEMEQRMMGEISLDSGMADHDGISILDSIADDRMNQEEMYAMHQEAHHLHNLVSNAVSCLNEKEQFIVENRIKADEPMTLQDIAEHFSISRERVRQIEENALRKLKSSLLPHFATA